jgi:NAD(P)-dependent dehydrogenase (short-subunit alcohol dehydrogenase family)
MPNQSAARQLSLKKKRVNGEVVVVTGAGGGIGLAVVRRLRSDGWSVVATDRDDASLASVRAEFNDDAKVFASVMDVAQRDTIDAVVEVLRKRGTGVAGLVNVAGLLQDVTPFLAMEAERQQAIWDVNYFGAVSCIQALAPLMIEGGGGSIVNITSINEHRPLPLHAYAPTKVALGALTQLTAGELGPKGIRVNAVAPGFTLTPIFKEKLETGKRNASVIEAHTAMGRLVETSEIASVISFLLSDDSSAITGASLPVDAGWMATSSWMNFRDLVQP